MAAIVIGAYFGIASAAQGDVGAGVEQALAFRSRLPQTQAATQHLEIIDRLLEQFKE